MGGPTCNCPDSTSYLAQLAILSCMTLYLILCYNPRKSTRKSTVPEKKLADRLREAIHLRGYSIRTEKAYVSWYERYVRFHKLRHPSTLGAAEAEPFLSHLAAHAKVAASTQGQALSALLFLYAEVLKIPLRAKKSTYIQPYFSHDDGLRLLEALRLRVNIPSRPLVGAGQFD